MPWDFENANADSLRSINPLTRGRGSQPHSWFMRIKLESHVGSGAIRVPFSVSARGSPTQSAFVLFWDFQVSGRIAYVINRTTTGVQKTYDGHLDTDWVSLIGTFSGGSAHANMNTYKNGVLLSSVASFDGVGDDWPFDDVLIANQQGTVREADGQISELAIWSRVLFRAERVELDYGANPLKFSNGLLSYTPLNTGRPRDLVTGSLYTKFGSPTHVGGGPVISPFYPKDDAVNRNAFAYHKKWVSPVVPVYDYGGG